MSGKAPFHPRYLPAAEIKKVLSSRRVLALISFGEAGLNVEDPRYFHVNLPELGGSNTIEVWHSEEPVRTGTQDNIFFACDDDILFGRLSFQEPPEGGMENAARRIYEDILRFLPSSGYPHLVRTWNYLPQITAEEHGGERYQAFCKGRYDVIAVHAGFEQNLPAASALGTQAGPLQVYFLAARKAAMQLENPRQISAFHYPRRYGPRSPSFSRAMLHRLGNAAYLYISGTASIVGHESRHAENSAEQLQEVLHNITTLINAARHEGGLNIHSPADLSLLKVYIRYPERDFAAVREHISQHAAPDVPALYLQAEVCRKDLLLEIEALYAGTQTTTGVPKLRNLSAT